ncbi:hypothetical protein NDU88_000593 [Pleurodeles waltl]|uniref:Uncharacterized protein n=1 Tax=Pleurodeles waltl TaxID=8319 RepID=A0AAV7KPB2_PLEWA|nr:hypothetical protein NDU88_000593 [Pleurodeles waltl]
MSCRYRSPRGNPGVVRFLPLFFPGGEEDEGPMMAEAVRGRRIVYSEERGLSVRVSVLLPGFQSQRRPPGPVPLFVVVSVMEFFPPIHRLDLGRSPRLGSELRLSGRGGGMQERRRGIRPPPGSAAEGSAFFRGFRASGALGFSSWPDAGHNPQVRSGPLAFAAQAALSPAARADSGPRPLRWGDGGDAGEQVGGSGPLPGSVPVGLAPVRGLRCSRPLLAAVTP